MAVSEGNLNYLIYHHRGGRHVRKTLVARALLEQREENQRLREEIKRLEGTIQHLVTKGVSSGR